MRKYRVLLPLVLLALSIVTMGTGSDLYPGPAGNSWGDFKAYFQGQIASGTALPEIASATEGDLFILYSSTYAGDPKIYRQEWIMTESGVVASWALMAGGSGGGVTDYSDLTGRPTSASWTYSEIDGNPGTPTSASWTHDDLSTVSESTGHDGRYAQPASNDPTYWQGPQVIGANGNSLQLASGSEIVGLHDGLVDNFMTIRRYTDTAGTQIFGGSTVDDGASLILSGQNANTGSKCAVTLTAHGGADALDGAINLRTYDTSEAAVKDRFQVGKTGACRTVPITGAPGDTTDHVIWNVSNSELNEGCLYFEASDHYLYLTASTPDGLDWWPVGRAYGDPTVNFSCASLTHSPYWQDLRVPLTTTKINPAGNPPVFDNFRGLSLGAYQFSGSANNECFFEAQLPHGIYGSSIDCHVHYSTEVDVGAATITMGLEYVITGTNQVIATTTTTLEASVYGGASGTHLLLDLGDIPLPSSGIDSAMISARFYRLGSDSFTGIVNVFEVDFHYQIDKPGSSLEYGDR